MPCFVRRFRIMFLVSIEVSPHNHYKAKPAPWQATRCCAIHCRAMTAGGEWLEVVLPSPKRNRPYRSTTFFILAERKGFKTLRRRARRHIHCYRNGEGFESTSHLWNEKGRTQVRPFALCLLAIKKILMNLFTLLPM